MLKNKIISRRRFLRTTLGAGMGAIGFPYVISSSALGKAGTVAPSERITLGHIGVGGQGGRLLEAFVHQKQAQSLAVCDPVTERRDRWAKYVSYFSSQKSNGGKTGSCVAYNDFRELLAREDIDAVVIATPCHWHIPIAIAAAKAGKDMYSEKPLGLTLEQDQTLRAVVNRYGTVFQYGTQQRSDSGFRFACELVRNGRIGKLHTIYVWCFGAEAGGSLTPEPIPEGFDYDLWLGPAPSAPFNTDRCFNRGKNWISDYALGFVAGWGAHPLDIAQWGNNTDDSGPVEYEGTATFPNTGLYDTAINWDVRCTYANGVKMRFMSLPLAQPVIEKYGKFTDHGTMFIGSDGWLNVDRNKLQASSPDILKSGIEPAEIHLYNSTSHQKNFLDCVKNRSKTICPIDQAVRTDTISQLIDIAIRTGKKLKWDPKKEAIVDDDGRSRMLSRAMRSPWHL